MLTGTSNYRSLRTSLKIMATPAPRPSQEASTVERITRLEDGQATLQTTVQRLAELQSDQAEMQAKEHGQTRKEIMTLAERFSNAGKPNFAVIIAACSFLLVLGTAVLSPLYFQIQENKHALTDLAREVADHRSMPIHPVAAARMEEREKASLREAALVEQLSVSRDALLDLKIQHLKP